MPPPSYDFGLDQMGPNLQHSLIAIIRPGDVLEVRLHGWDSEPAAQAFIQVKTVEEVTKQESFARHANAKTNGSGEANAFSFATVVR